jgi:glycosyltransferase involved in cell wall biosynthesis
LALRDIGVFAPLFPPAKNGGGPIRTLEALVAGAPNSFGLHVLTGDRDLGASERLPVEFDSWSEHDGAAVYYASAGSLKGLFGGLGALRQKKPDVIYLNGYFDPRFSILPQLLWRVGYWGGAVRLLAPRGEFGSGALERRTGKKRAYMAVYRLLGLHRRIYWHASSEMEAAAIRAQWGEGANILIRENETLLPERAQTVGDAAVASSPVAALRAVFLGRIVEHKGLHLALEALAGVVHPVELDVYGPAEDDVYLRRCQALAANLPDHVVVQFRGPLEPEQTRRTLGSYEVLVMPTAGENFGHVIAESLSVSCPVLCSTHTPWTDVLEAGGGSALTLTVKAWTEALERQAGLSITDRVVERRRAGAAYDEWRSRPAAPHVFELLEQAISSRSRA